MWVAAFLLLVIVGGLSEARDGRFGCGIRIWVLDCSLWSHGTENLLARATYDGEACILILYSLCSFTMLFFSRNDQPLLVLPKFRKL